MIRGVLPAIYLDDVRTSTTAGLIVANEIPERDTTNASTASSIVLEILSTLPTGVDRDTVRIYVEGELAFEGGAAPEFKPGFDGPGSAVVALAPHDLRVTIDPLEPFASEELVAVRVVAEDLGATEAIDFVYTFAVEDVTIPTVVSARATFANVIRVTFSEDMLAVSSSGTGDALNPTLYSAAFVPATDREAGVSSAVSSVAAVTSRVFDLTTALELTFGRAYRLTVGAVVDDSPNHNAVAPPDNVADFVSWFPPDWPTGRRFRFWDMLSDYDREHDTTGDLERLCSIYQDTIDLLLWDCDRFPRIWDIDKAPIEFIEVMLADLGNPFALELTESKARKLAGLLIPMYRQKGTDRGIINAIRFLLGIEVTIEQYIAGCWILGVDELGVGTIAGPPPGADWYTFAVVVPRALTDEERRQMRAIVNYAKPAHTHFQIVEPYVPPVIDHWSMGESLLGTETELHE